MFVAEALTFLSKNYPQNSKWHDYFIEDRNDLLKTEEDIFGVNLCEQELCPVGSKYFSAQLG